MTGESEPQGKNNICQPEKENAGLFELENVAFMGTSVICGTGVALVLRTGDGKCSWEKRDVPGSPNRL